MCSPLPFSTENWLPGWCFTTPNDPSRRWRCKPLHHPFSPTAQSAKCYGPVQLVALHEVFLYYMGTVLLFSGRTIFWLCLSSLYERSPPLTVLTSSSQYRQGGFFSSAIGSEIKWRHTIIQLQAIEGIGTWAARPRGRSRFRRLQEDILYDHGIEG